MGMSTDIRILAELWAALQTVLQTALQTVLLQIVSFNNKKNVLPSFRKANGKFYVANSDPGRLDIRHQNETI